MKKVIVAMFVAAFPLHAFAVGGYVEGSLGYTFVSDVDVKGSGASDLARAAAFKACYMFAIEGFDGTIVSQSAMTPGWWEIVMRFEQYRYACNVSSSGQVQSFNKIN